MNHTEHNRIVNFIWSIADDVLRDVYVRGKYRDVILPMTVIRRLDCVLEPTKDEVMKQKARLDKAGIIEQDFALQQAAKRPFHNTSIFTLKNLLDKPKQLKSNFIAYLDGYSENVQKIIDKFDFRNQLAKMDAVDALGDLIEKFISQDINLSPEPVKNEDGSEKLPGLDNHGMGYVFEELIRRFSEENNEEAGEHFTPREVVRLMASLIFLPVADKIEDSTYLVYDCACGTGGMLTLADSVLKELAEKNGKKVSIHLYGQEINAETYAICTADLLLKGMGQEARNIEFGSTLSSDANPSMEFHFMLANPPFGKSWKSDLNRLCGGNKKDMTDPRFIVNHGDNPEFSLVTRSSDGQLMFLVNMLSKMKPPKASPFGSRVAIVHNGSSLFTGDAGQGESNIRQWIIENDWLEAIVALPLNMFYNTGIATYIWVLTNKKPEHRQGKVQLIDATQWFTKLRKNLGQKNCELKEGDIQRICDVFLKFEDTEHSKIFPNDSFGYWKIVVERPLRLKVELTEDKINYFRNQCVEAGEEPIANVTDRVALKIGSGPHMDFNEFLDYVKADCNKNNVKLTTKSKKMLQTILAEKDENAEPVIQNKSRLKKGASVKDNDVLYGRYEQNSGKTVQVVEYEPDTALRDTEQIPLTEDGGIEAFFQREILPHVPDAWIDESKIVIGYEIPFTRHFYKYEPLRTSKEIKADIIAVDKETEGLLNKIMSEV